MNEETRTTQGWDCPCGGDHGIVEYSTRDNGGVAEHRTQVTYVCEPWYKSDTGWGPK